MARSLLGFHGAPRHRIPGDGGPADVFSAGGLLRAGHSRKRNDSDHEGVKRWQDSHDFGSALRSATHLGILTTLATGACPQGSGMSAEAINCSDLMSLSS